jgi:RNA ligase
MSRELIAALEERVSKGLINRRDRGPLSIYNYTDTCTFDRAWDDYTMAARGLIVNQETGKIVARGFSKFFNYGENSDIDYTKLGNFEATEKLDGSLGILYWDELTQMYRIATRGSFESDQAIWATEWLHKKFPVYAGERESFGGGLWTLLFEIIYPDNRIIVDYHGVADLFLIGVVNNESAQSYSYDLVKAMCPDGIRVVKSVQVTNIQELVDLASKPTGKPTDEEGWVVFWPEAQLRIKVKRDDYMQLARILSRMSARAVFEAVRDGTFESLIKDLPPELANVPRLLEAEVNTTYWSVYGDADMAWIILCDHITPEMSRKDKALLIKGHVRLVPHASCLFSMLDGHDTSKWLWSQVEDRLKKTGYFVRRLPTEEITP